MFHNPGGDWLPERGLSPNSKYLDKQISVNLHLPGK